MSENYDETADGFLDWYCWAMAMTAERFHPPDETADECVEHFEESTEESVYTETETYDGDEYVAYKQDSAILVTERSRAQEYATHARALGDAVEFFHDMEMRGFDPKARAEREIERSRERGLDLEDIDWSWYEATGRLGRNRSD